MKVTIKDIAKIAGVSHSTVSRSLNNHSSISVARRRQVVDIARNIGFEFNINAQGLRGGAVGTVGIIAPVIREEDIFLNDLLQKIIHHENNSFLDYIVARPHRGDTSNIRRLIRAGKVDGFILFSPNIASSDYKFLFDQNIPHVLLHFKQPAFQHEGLNYFLTDHEYGGYLATTHLIQSGRRHIISVTEDGNDDQFMDRSSGFKRALEEHGMPFNDYMLAKGQCSYGFGEHFVYEHRELFTRVDAIFAQADILALGMIQALGKLGIRVPDDVAIIGYDDILISQYSTPGLSTIHQPTEDMDHQACLRIAELISGKNTSYPTQKVFKPGLIVRDTCLGT